MGESLPRINVQDLPKQIQDIIDLKENTDMTFSRFVDEEYTEIFWDVMNQRRGEVEHSVIISVYGAQGCHLKGTLIQTGRGLIPIEGVTIEDVVWAGDAWRPCVPIVQGRKQTLKVTLRNGAVLNLTPDHKMQTVRGWTSAEDLVVGDSMVPGNIPWSTVWNDESERAMVIGMVLADGHMDRWMVKEKYDYKRISNYKLTRKPKEYHEYEKKRVRLYNKDAEVHAQFTEALRKHYLATASGSYEDVVNGVRRSTVTCIQNADVCDALENAGVPYGNKVAIVEIPRWVQISDAAMNGFMAGYFVCDGSFYKGGVEIASTSEKILRQMQSWLCARGVVSTLFAKKEVKKNHKQVWRLIIRQWDAMKDWVDHIPSVSGKKVVEIRKKDTVAWVKYSDDQVAEWWKLRNSGMSYQCLSEHVGVKFATVWLAMNKKTRGVKKEKSNSTKDHLLQVASIEMGEFGDVYDLHVKDVHEYIANGVVSHNSGKSLSAMSLCCYLDPSFNVDQIYFSYNDLVYNRHNLRDNCAVLVDEQSQTYGLDAHRIMVILANLKEQLRKRGIHFIFCSPTLYEESKSSMYLLETIFIDEEEKECVCALKTREGLTLGHVRVPHPLKPVDEKGGLASQELYNAYQAKKDRHLEKVLGRNDYDIFEERAEQVVKHPLFKRAEKIYVMRYGYMPQSSLQQLINKLYPEFNAGVVSAEIAGRVRLNKEMSGEWDISGKSTKKKSPLGKGSHGKARL